MARDLFLLLLPRTLFLLRMFSVTIREFLYGFLEKKICFLKVNYTKKLTITTSNGKSCGFFMFQSDLTNSAFVKIFRCSHKVYFSRLVWIKPKKVCDLLGESAV